MEALCRTCGKPPLATRAGSVTSYFFQHNYCQCHNKNASSSETVSSKPHIAGSAETVCSNCGKSRPTTRRAGSLTAFLFKELRCTCAGSSSKSSGRSNNNFEDNSGGGSTRRLIKARSRTAVRVAQRKQFTESFRKSKVSGATNTEALFNHGAIIGGAFRIDSMIGLGGMGVVYLAEQLSLKKQVALKILAPELVNEQSWQRFRAEAKTLAGLNHSSLVKVYDLGIHDNSIPYYSMDFLQGQSLEEILATTGPLKLGQALNVFIEVLDGLAYAHRNAIIHRDIKPGNVMLCTIDGVEAVKILDFGISKLVGGHASSSQSLTAVGEIFGSPFYMSPEQCAGGAVDARSDIYSVGCTLIEALTGFVPFEGDEFIETAMMHQEDVPPKLSELNSDLKYPPSLDKVIAKCLAKRPDDRYQSSKEMALDLSRVLDGKAILAQSATDFYDKTSAKTSATRESSGARETARKSLPGPLLPLFAGVAVVLALVSVCVFLIFKSPQTSPTPPIALAGGGKVAQVPATVDLRSASISRAGNITREKNAGESAHASLNKRPADVGNPFIIEIDEYGLPKQPVGSEKESFMYSKIIVEKGVRLRRFNFPTDIVIGKIKVANSESSKSATGIVDVPADAELGFMPDQLVASYPQYLKRFRQGDIVSLFMFVPIENDHILAAASNIPGIRGLHMSGEGGLSEKGFESVSRFRNLDTFSLVNAKLTGEVLANTDCWQKIQNVTWLGSTKPEAFLRKLQASSQLRALTLSARALTHADYRLIGTLTSLKTLVIPSNTMTLEDLEAVASLPNVTYLDIHACGLGQRAIPILKKMPKLRELKMLRSNSSPEFKMKLINGLPHVRVYGWSDLK